MTFAIGVAHAQTQTQRAVEYRHAAWNAYFVTAFPDEIAMLDAGAFGGVWTRTGESFEVWTTPQAGGAPACRFFSAAYAPRSAHFYTPFAEECARVGADPAWVYEGVAFHLELPDGRGACPAGSVALYRLYNNGAGSAPNHRYTTRTSIADAMRTAGWTLEGNGATGAFACTASTAGPPTAGAQGYWYGSTEAGSAVFGIVRDDGAAYLMYSFVGAPDIAGMIVGDATDAAGRFSMSGARDIGFGYGVQALDLAGTYVPGSGLNVTFRYPSFTTSLSASYETSYAHPSDVAAAAGTFTGGLGTAAAWSGATLTLRPSGEFTGTAAGCAFSGVLSTRGNANVLDAAVTFGGAPCALGSSLVFGAAYYDASGRHLYVLAPNASRSDGVLFAGGR